MTAHHGIVVVVWLTLAACSPKSTPYRVEIADARGVEVDAPVLVAGVRVGRVAAVALDGEKARIDFEITDDAGVRLSTGACVRIAPKGMLGDMQLEITPGEEGSPLESGARVDGCSAGSASLDAVMAQSLEAVTSLAAIMEKANSGEGVVAKLLNDKQLADDVASFAQRSCSPAAPSSP